MKKYLPSQYFYTNWRGNYSEVLPYLHEAFSMCLIEMEASMKACNIEPNQATELQNIIKQLCNPEPKKRGHPISLLTKGDPFSLERYISTFDKLARLFEIKAR